MLPKILSLLAAGFIASSCQTASRDVSSPKYLLLTSGWIGCAFAGIPEGEVRVHITGGNSIHTEFARLALEKWVEEIKSIDPSLDATVKVTDQNPHYEVEIHNEPGRGYADCRKVVIYDRFEDDEVQAGRPGVYLHEFGHAFIGLADTYVESSGECKPHQPMSLMCSHQITNGQITPDDIQGLKASLQTQQEVLHRSKITLEFSKKAAQSFKPDCNLSVTDIQLNGNHDRMILDTKFTSDLTTTVAPKWTNDYVVFRKNFVQAIKASYGFTRIPNTCKIRIEKLIAEADAGSDQGSTQSNGNHGDDSGVNQDDLTSGPSDSIDSDKTGACVIVYGSTPQSLKTGDCFVRAKDTKLMTYSKCKMGIFYEHETAAPFKRVVFVPGVETCYDTPVKSINPTQIQPGSGILIWP